MLLTLLAHRDYCTYQHSLRVAEIARRIGLVMGLEEEELLYLEHGSLVHDVGKLAIPDDVLLKPGAFTSPDRCIMNSHPLIGAQLFDDKGIDERIIAIILKHHERLDGSGYPEGLQADQIPLCPRIVAVADVYEALVAKRPYKPERNRNDALEIIFEDVEAGRLDTRAAGALAKVTRNWDPCSIKGRDYSASQALLEGFRHTCYFREPLIQFHNYRLLFSLEKNSVPHLSAEPYVIYVISFRKLKTLNREKGYLTTDNILCAFGESLQHRINALIEPQSDTEKPLLLFLKKGADFIIYNRHEPGRCREIRRLIRENVVEAEHKWGIEGECRQRRFSNGETFTEAFDLLFVQGINYETEVGYT
jgi:putative nucleotidyltransferase with HDIG domain